MIKTIEWLQKPKVHFAIKHRKKAHFLLVCFYVSKQMQREKPNANFVVCSSPHCQPLLGQGHLVTVEKCLSRISPENAARMKSCMLAASVYNNEYKRWPLSALA